MLAGNRDVHMNVANMCEGTEVPKVYSAAMAVAIASLVSGRLPELEVAVLGEVNIDDGLLSTDMDVEHPHHVACLVAQGFKQLVVSNPDNVDKAMVDLLEECSIELEGDEDITFSSALPFIFGLANDDDEPEDTQEAGTVREKKMELCSCLGMALHTHLCDTCFAPQGVKTGGHDGTEEEDMEEAAEEEDA